MKKDEALVRRDRLVRTLEEGLQALRIDPLTEDGKLYHEELEGENRWAVRLSRAEVWPHVSARQGPRAMPGLRYEVWLWQKRSEAWIALLNSRQGPVTGLIDVLKPCWLEWVEGGKFARRYKPIEGLWQTAYPQTDGIWRAVPVDARSDRLEQALLTLVRDTLPGVEKAVERAAEKAGGKAASGGTAVNLAAEFKAANEARNPLAELAAKFNTRR